MPKARGEPSTAVSLGERPYGQVTSDGVRRGGLREDYMSTLLLLILILLLIGALPTWPYSANWGYYPSGGLGLVLLILVILLLTGRLSTT